MSVVTLSGPFEFVESASSRLLLLLLPVRFARILRRVTCPGSRLPRTTSRRRLLRRAVHRGSRCVLNRCLLGRRNDRLRAGVAEALEHGGEAEHAGGRHDNDVLGLVVVGRAADGVVATADRWRLFRDNTTKVEVRLVVVGRTEVLAARQFLNTK